MDMLSHYHKKFSHIPIDEYVRDIEKISRALNGIRELNTFKSDITLLLYTFSISEKRLKVLSNLKFSRPSNSMKRLNRGQ